MTRSHVCGALGAAALLTCATGSFAHTTLERREAEPNVAYKAVLQINHGCKGSPTTAVTVTLPDGMIAARAMPKPGWTLSTSRGAYSRPYPYFGRELAEGVREITWSGGELPDDQYDEFVFTARFSDIAFQAGSVAHLPVVQTCAVGAHRWVEIPAAGQTARDLKEPAPTVRIGGAARVEQASSRLATATTVGALTVEQPWIRATPGGAKVAGGYVRITNRGAEPDRLVGTSVPLAARGEVHEMSMENGVMKMREVEGGIQIPPGATVELKPGGLHLMFMDLKAPAKEGERVRGTLVFERAGTVEVTFEVGGIGARAAPAGEHSHH